MEQLQAGMWLQQVELAGLCSQPGGIFLGMNQLLCDSASPDP